MRICYLTEQTVGSANRTAIAFFSLRGACDRVGRPACENARRPQARVCEVIPPSSSVHAVRVRYDDFTEDWDQWVGARRIIRKLPNGVI